MADRAKKEKVRRSLSLSRRNVGGPAPSSAPPISSFFSSAPSKLACPLCGELVARFKINEHIDVQCPRFDRGEGSGSDDVVRVSSSRNRPMSPQPAQEEEEEVRETQSSPYFKQQASQQEPQHQGRSTAVRKLSLSNKLSTLVRTPTDNEMSGSCSQKENIQSEIQSFKDSKFQPPAASNEEDLSSCSGGGCHQDNSEIATGDLPSSKLSKRKKATFSLRLKKAKHDETKDKQENMDLKTTVETYAAQLSKTKVLPQWDLPLTLEENIIFKESPAATTKSESEAPWLPYYLQNFRTVLQAVLENEDDKALFNQEDMSYVHAFEKLSVTGQKLYVRLFQRKLKWLQVSKLSYEEISNDLVPTGQELLQAGFVQNEHNLDDLGEALDLLLAPDLKALAKTFHLGSSGSQKQQLVDGLLRLSRQKSLFSSPSAQNNIGTVILKRAKQMAGSCVRLCRSPRAVFSRILLLFSLTNTLDEEELAAGGQSQLFTILMVNSGRLAFPEYTVQRETKLFQDREDLIRYEASMRALLDVTLAMQSSQWEKALELYNAAKTDWEELQKSHDLSYQEGLPTFLRSFTTGWAYTRILSRGVEILQRLRCYKEAVEELQSLLQQSVYCCESRGRWWDRLALNLHQHLKKPEQAICVIRDGLLDPLVRTGHKLSLHLRAVRMKVSPSYKKYRLQLEKLPTIQFQDVKHVTIRGQLFPHEGGTGKSRFLLPATEDGDEKERATVICSVEELCLAHYRQQGFDQGIHGEGSTFSTLFALLLWDIIFMEGIPDVFRNPYQTCPLDLHTDSFYENRSEAIESRIQLLSDSSEETLNNMLEDVWNSQQGKVCLLINWERFSSFQQAQTLVACMGGAFLSGVIARMAKDYRHCRGGLPDLVVWSTLNNTYKLVEVKGPSDRLSQKQQIWLDELQKLGADVEVCHVEATGARRSRLE